MYRNSRENLVAGMFGIGCFVLLLLISGVVGIFTWPYVLNSWLVFFGKNPEILWWHGFILGILPWFGQISIPAAIGTWILLMFLV